MKRKQKQVQVQETPERLTIVQKFGWGNYIFFVLCLAFDAFVLFVLYMVFWAGPGNPFVSAPEKWLYTLGAAVLMLAVTYYCLVRAVNHNIFTVDRQALTIEHAPLPWPFPLKKNWPTSSISQLYIEESRADTQRTP